MAPPKGSVFRQGRGTRTGLARLDGNATSAEHLHQEVTRPLPRLSHQLSVHDDAHHPDHVGIEMAEAAQRKTRHKPVDILRNTVVDV